MAASAPVPIIIPAYKPTSMLHGIVHDLLTLGDNPIILVDDGSGPEYTPLFTTIASNPRVHLVQHAVNLGKGVALKTGMNHALVHFPNASGVVSADADGQHHPQDILRVAETLMKHKNSLVMGVRSFIGDVPLRSRFGNTLTRILMRLLIGQRLSDTQTGLRGIPSSLIPHLLHMPSSGYEFELDMLISCKHQGYLIVQEPIRTIYDPGNASSHFHPLFDSMRIYFVLLRFSMLALLTAILDNLVFIVVFLATSSIVRAQLCARGIAMMVNYLGARTVVFNSKQPHAVVLPKYVALVVVNGIMSYAFIQLFHTALGVGTISAKLIAESLLFIANFTLQRDIVFTRRPADQTGLSTDWDKYYVTVPAVAKLTRRYTAGALLEAIKKHSAFADSSPAPISILEIGGANSCFVDRILSAITCERYDVVDTNAYGLSLLSRRLGDLRVVNLHEKSVLGLRMERQADIVFSVGLVEHFAPDETREAVAAHFVSLKPGGTAIITFPTPTLLYRTTRHLLETFSLWRFYDERPLTAEEVIAAIPPTAQVIYQKTLWPILLTQHLIVARRALEEGLISNPAQRALA